MPTLWSSVRGKNVGPLLAALFVGIPGLTNCTGKEPTIEPRPLRPIAEALVRPVADGLDAQGHFTLHGPLDLPYPQITADRAVALADAFRGGPLRGFLPYLERDRGGRISATALKLCGRVYYAEPAIEALPLSVDPAVRRGYGPHWILNYCGASGHPEVAVAVSAYATDLRIENGQLVYPVFYGGEYFHPIGIPRDRTGGLPGTPENAAAEAAAISGARVASVPRLVTPPRKHPVLSFWRIELEHPVTLRGGNSKHETSTSTVYFTDDPRWGHRGRWISQIGGPTEFEYSWPVPPVSAGVPATFLKGRSPARAGFPIKIEPVEEASR